jgi:hypothetical protein
MTSSHGARILWSPSKIHGLATATGVEYLALNATASGGPETRTIVRPGSCLPHRLTRALNLAYVEREERDYQRERAKHTQDPGVERDWGPRGSNEVSGFSEVGCRVFSDQFRISASVSMWSWTSPESEPTCAIVRVLSVPPQLTQLIYNRFGSQSYLLKNGTVNGAKTQHSWQLR